MNAPIDIRIEDPRQPKVIALLEEHLRDMYRTSPPESVHSLDLDGLRQPALTFWAAWSGDTLAGCAALKMLDAEHAEIKSMRVSDAFRGAGVGQLLLNHLIDTARQRGCTRMSLETGSHPYFEPARRLYAKFGFRECGPFAAYPEDPYSHFMTRELTDA